MAIGNLKAAFAAGNYPHPLHGESGYYTANGETTKKANLLTVKGVVCRIKNVNAKMVMVMEIIELIAVVAAIFGVGWICSQALRSEVKAIDAKVDAIKESVKQGQAEHSELRADIRASNARVDAMLNVLLVAQSKDNKP